MINTIIISAILGYLLYDHMISKNVIIIFIIILTSMCVLNNLFFSVTEDFTSTIGDGVRIINIDLEHLFNFIEFWQTTDLSLDPYVHPQGNIWQDRSGSAYGGVGFLEAESAPLRDNIKSLMETLHFLIKTNNGDNFYNRFLVQKIGSNLNLYDPIRARRLNFDELVYNKVNNQFGYNEQAQIIDSYAPRVNLGSKNQQPLPTSVNVHNYYDGSNVEVNLLALSRLLDLAEENNRNLFASIVRPTEHPIFKDEFLIPLRRIKNTIWDIAHTVTYSEYLKTHKFDIKYE